MIGLPWCDVLGLTLNMRAINMVRFTFLNRLFFLKRSFGCIAKLNRTYRVLIYLSFSHMHSLPINISQQNDTFVIISESVWNTSWQPKVYSLLRFTLSGVHSVGLNEYIMPHIHQYRIIQSNFTALKKSSVLCLLISPSLLTPDTHSSFYCLHSIAFSRMSYL